MLEKLDSQKLSDESLDEVTGGGLFKDLFDSMKSGKQGKKPHSAGEKKQGEYKCHACNKFFSWTLDSDPICPNCREMFDLDRISDLIAAGPFCGK